MKAMRNITRTFALIVTAGITFNFFGCSGNSPVTPEAGTVSKREMNFIKLGDAITSLNKGSTTVSSWMTTKDGGHLEIVRGAAFAENHADSTIKDDYKTVDYETVSSLKVNLDVMGCCLREGIELSMTLDGQGVDMEFGPHGTTFLTPVLLNITAVGLDLREVNEETLALYYDNPETGQWEKVVNEGIEILKSSVYLRVLNAELPHFSRYAVAWSN